MAETNAFVPMPYKTLTEEEKKAILDKFEAERQNDDYKIEA